MKNFSNNSYWITADTCPLIDWSFPVNPAPLFRKEFELENVPEFAECIICGLGLYELYLNGKKVGDHVLDVPPSHYDRRAFFVRYDLTELLKKGRNVIGVMLGNGYYNCHAKDVWHFDKASWRDYPKLRFELECDKNLTVVSDTSWLFSTGAIIYDELRNGETYDANSEQKNWNCIDFDAQHWKNVILTHGPGGVLCESRQESCKVIEKVFPVSIMKLTPNCFVVDFGINMTGWGKFKFRGQKGQKISIQYGERIYDNGHVDIEHISKCHADTRFQLDEYIPASNEVEIYEPKFTYHGFRYAEIVGAEEIIEAEGCFVATAFRKIGEITSSNEKLNKLHEACVRGYLGNFTAIPTDCPHREKNGWTADAHLASELGLCNFASEKAYEQFLLSITDAQRPDGQLPGIIPSAGWGFNWGNGPAWDSALLILAENIYNYSGNIEPIKENLSAMERYVNYCIGREVDNLVSFGLGDWACLDNQYKVEDTLVVSAFHYANLLKMAKFYLLIEPDNVEKINFYQNHAEKVKKAFNQKFRLKKGDYGDKIAAYGITLYFKLAESGEEALVAQKLSELVKDADYEPRYGIIGNKTVPRVLADFGYVETAYKILTRPTYPGFFNCLDRGATTIWGIWKGDTSLNHIMYGDVDAWFYKYLGGLNVSAGVVSLAPKAVENLSKFQMKYYDYCCSYEKIGNKLYYQIDVPKATQFTFACGKIIQLEKGVHNMEEDFKEFN